MGGESIPTIAGSHRCFPRRIIEPGAGRVAAARLERVEESPDSAGQDAGENPRRGDPWKVQQRADRSRCAGVRVKG